MLHPALLRDRSVIRWHPAHGAGVPQELGAAHVEADAHGRHPDHHCEGEKENQLSSVRDIAFKKIIIVFFLSYSTVRIYNLHIRLILVQQIQFIDKILKNVVQFIPI